MALGCYTDPYFPASFKGVAFEAMEISSEHGRRGAEGEFPFGENTAYADLGRRIRTYRISGRFAQNQHVALSAALIAVCEATGPGLLVHPTRGPVIAACRSLTVKDNPMEEQGVSYFDAEFVEANSWISGFVFIAGLFAIGLQALSIAAQDSFDANWSPTGPQRGTAATAAAAVVSDVRNRFAIASQPSASDVKVQRALSDFDQLLSDPTTLLTGDTLKKAVTLGVAAIDRYATSSQKFTLLTGLANFSATQKNRATGAVGNSIEALYSLVRIISAGYMAKAVTEMTPTTLNEALQQYDKVIIILDDEAAIARERCDNALFLALRKFRTEAQTALLNRAYLLPALITYKFGSSVHSLVAAYEIYNDARRFAEIERANPGDWPFAVGPNVVAAS